MTILLRLLPVSAVVLCVYLAAYLHAQPKKSPAMRHFTVICYLVAGMYSLSFFMFYKSNPAHGIVLAHIISALAMVTAGRVCVFMYAFIGKRPDPAYRICLGITAAAAIASVFLPIHAVVSAVPGGGTIYPPGRLHGFCFALGLSVPLFWSGALTFFRFLNARDPLDRLRARYLCVALSSGLLLSIGVEVVLPLVFNINEVTRFMAISSMITMYLVFRAVIHHRFLDFHAEEIEAVTRRLFADLTESIVIFDAQGIVIQCNNASARFFGLDPAVITKKTLQDLIPEYQFERSYVDHPFTCTMNGTARTIRISQSAISDSTVSLGKILIMRDVTDQERMEQELAKSHQREMLGLLAGGIAHDFNNFLTGIMANLSLIRKLSAPGTETTELAADGEKAAGRATALVNQLLTFSKGGAPAREALSAKELIEDTVRFALSGRNTRCEVRLPPDLMPIMADRSQISQIFQNLAINAAEAMPQGGTVSITGRNRHVETGGAEDLAKGDYVEIDVADTGVGIPPESMGRIFEPFYTTKPKGKGLGLSIAYSILKKHNGSIRVSSRQKQGTTVTLFIPASHENATAKKLVPCRSSQASGAILVMEDEPSIRKVLHIMLGNMGYRIESVADGAKALEMYDAALSCGEGFDAVLTDLTVPGGIGGKELEVELHKRTPGLPVIVMSGYSEDSVIADFARHGFAASIKKPFGYHDIESVLAGALGARSARSAHSAGCNALES